MKKNALLIFGTWLLFASTALAAGNGLRPMLVQGKTWWYTHHHFEDSESAKGQPASPIETASWEVSYTLRGDTAIDGRQYMKMYRRDYRHGSNRYYGALREDEQGRVWQYNADDEKEFMLCDVTCSYYPGPENMAIPDIVNIGGQLLHRWRWNGFTGIEGVGFAEKGLIRYLYDDVNCICDYESFAFVMGNDLYFSASDFTAPKYIELTDGERQLVAQNNDFAFSLFRKTRGGKSIIMSPLSVTYALGMLNNGAKGQTQQEICSVLGFNDTQAQNEFCLKMMNELAAAGYVDTTTKAHISNTIFVNKGMGWQLQPDFTHLASNYYHAYPQSRNFGDGQTRNVINQWGSDHTEGMIKEVLREEEFNPTAVSYLLNAIYFKGLWSDPFETEETRDEVFDNSELVPMMHKNTEMRYAENDLCQAVCLPYGNGTYLLHVLLPREDKTLSEVAESLDGKNWQLQGHNCEVDLKLPRFETNSDINLKTVMAELGMPTAFDPVKADFTNLCVDNQGENLYIGLMKQVAKIKLDEKGTEAAAITVIGMEATAMPDVATFHANRPFLYVISEQSTGIILFIGQYMGNKMTAAIRDVDAHDSKSEITNADAVYDLQGRRIEPSPLNSQLSTLRRGIYVRDGKKLVR